MLIIRTNANESQSEDQLSIWNSARCTLALKATAALEEKIALVVDRATSRVLTAAWITGLTKSEEKERRFNIEGTLLDDYALIGKRIEMNTSYNPIAYIEKPVMLED